MASGKGDLPRPAEGDPTATLPPKEGLEGRGVDAICVYIKAQHDRNEEAIQRIEARMDVTVRYFDYAAEPKISDEGFVCEFALTAEPGTRTVRESVEAWKQTIELLDIFDVFNMKVSYKCNTYVDLVRLNKEMYEVSARYPIICDDNSRRAATELMKFVANFERVAAGLAQVTDLCRDQVNMAGELQGLLTQAHRHMAQAANMGLRFGPAGSLPHSLKALGADDASITQLQSWIPAPAGAAGGAAAAAAAPTPRLRYRATRDGFGAGQFHAKCDGVGRLLVVIKSTNGYIFGGFSTVAFDSSTPNGRCINDNTAFLYSLKNPSSRPNTLLRNTGGTNSVFSRPDYGPTYGNSHDLYIANNGNTTTCSSNLGSCYQGSPTGNGGHFFTGNSQFTVAEVLAFAV